MIFWVYDLRVDWSCYLSVWQLSGDASLTCTEAALFQAPRLGGHRHATTFSVAGATVRTWQLQSTTRNYHAVARHALFLIVTPLLDMTLPELCRSDARTLFSVASGHGQYRSVRKKTDLPGVLQCVTRSTSAASQVLFARIGLNTKISSAPPEPANTTKPEETPGNPKHSLDCSSNDL